jgi:hypothetical protein
VVLTHHLLLLVSDEDAQPYVILHLASSGVWECAGAWPTAGSDRYPNQYDTKPGTHLLESQGQCSLEARSAMLNGETKCTYGHCYFVSYLES